MEDEIDVAVDSWCGLVTSECSSPELCVFCVGVEGENRGVAGWAGVCVPELGWLPRMRERARESYVVISIRDGVAA